MTHPVILEACQKHKIDVSAFFGRGRTQRSMACRAEVAQIFRDRGHSWVMIANLLKRNRDTIRYWLDPRVRRVRKNYMLKRWHEVYKHQSQRPDPVHSDGAAI